MDKITNSLLLLSKSFILKAEHEFNQKTNVNRMQTMMNAQDSVEFCMNAIMNERGIRHELHDAHGTRWKRINESIAPNKLPFETQMDFVNNARGKVKHHASIPSIEDTEKALRYVRSFFDWVLDNQFGVTFDSLSMVNLIMDEEVRSLLEQAAQQIVEGNYLEALISIKKAFLMAKPSLDALIKPTYFEKTFQFIPDRGGFQARGDMSQRLEAKVKQLEEALVNLMLGIEAHKLRRFEAITPLMTERQILWDKNIKPTKELADEAIVFVTETLLRWQETGVFRAECAEKAEPSWEIVR